jgi:ABC-2 type transport system ATP-binding protein
MEPILAIRSLTKCFRHNWTLRQFIALERLDLDVRRGEIFGLIGPNGAGKTTTFKVVLGLLRPTSGRILFQGAPLLTAARAAIGFLPEQPYFYDYLTVRETLTMYGRLYGLSGSTLAQRVAQVIERVQLGHKRSAALRSLSKGTLQRVGIAQAILNHPDLLILDEPMSGLDPIGRHTMRELIRELRGGGTTVIFSSHILPDAEVLCDRVAILTRGTLREVIDLRAGDGEQAYHLTVSGVAVEALGALARLTNSTPQAAGGAWRIRVSGSSVVGPALDLVRSAAGSVDSLVPVHASLEERFLEHVGHGQPVD